MLFKNEKPQTRINQGDLNIIGEEGQISIVCIYSEKARAWE